MGQSVRYDGGHKYNRRIVEELGKQFELVSFCPEVGIGLGVPRKPIHLRQFGDALHAVEVANGQQDYTRDIKRQAKVFVDAHPDIRAYIFKARSPSCAVGSAKIHDRFGRHIHSGANGIFAATVMRLCPDAILVQEAELENEELYIHLLSQIY